MPFRKVFDVVASGRRQRGDGRQPDRPARQPEPVGIRRCSSRRGRCSGCAAPGNTINHPTSYWVGRHSTRVFTESVDIVSGIGYDKVDPGNPAF